MRTKKGGATCKKTPTSCHHLLHVSHGRGGRRFLSGAKEIGLPPRREKKTPDRTYSFCKGRLGLSGLLLCATERKRGDRNLLRDRRVEEQ